MALSGLTLVLLGSRNDHKPLGRLVTDLVLGSDE